MSLLELEHVSKCYGGDNQRIALREVSLQLYAGELVAVWGQRRSGRSTLLRIAAGVQAPDSGKVRLAGIELKDRPGGGLGDGIGYCHTAFRAGEGQLVLDHLTVGQVARGVPRSLAASRACAALERAEVGSCATMRPSELDSAEIVRAAIARTLAFGPRVLLIDEPTMGVDVLARDGILLLLQSLAHEGMGVLATTGESTGLSGARALTLSEGELHGPTARELARVVPLRRSA